MVYDLFSDFFGDDFFTLKPVYSSHTTKDIECPLCKTRLSKVLKTDEDICHPTIEGHKLIAEKLCSFFRKLDEKIYTKGHIS